MILIRFLADDVAHDGSNHRRCGQGDAAAAEQRWREAREGFLELGELDYAGEISLELAVLCHAQGRSAAEVEVTEVPGPRSLAPRSPGPHPRHPRRDRKPGLWAVRIRWPFETSW